MSRSTFIVRRHGTNVSEGEYTRQRDWYLRQIQILGHGYVDPEVVTETVEAVPGSRFSSRRLMHYQKIAELACRAWLFHAEHDVGCRSQHLHQYLTLEAETRARGTHGAICDVLPIFDPMKCRGLRLQPLVQLKRKELLPIIEQHAPASANIALARELEHVLTLLGLRFGMTAEEYQAAVDMAQGN